MSNHFCQELQANLDSVTAMQLLQQIHTLGLTLTDLRQACEEEIAKGFYYCAYHHSFCDLGATQLARILSRSDLWVEREEVVVEGLFRWMRASSERWCNLGMLLQHIDFPSLSMKNLERLSEYSQSLGQHGFELQYSVDEAKQRGSRRWQHHMPKRDWLQFWSPELGAFPRGYRGGRWVAGDWSHQTDGEDEDDPHLEPRGFRKTT